jgi:hypothetical protein
MVSTWLVLCRYLVVGRYLVGTVLVPARVLTGTVRYPVPYAVNPKP